MMYVKPSPKDILSLLHCDHEFVLFSNSDQQEDHIFYMIILQTYKSSLTTVKQGGVPQALLLLNLPLHPQMIDAMISHCQLPKCADPIRRIAP